MVRNKQPKGTYDFLNEPLAIVGMNCLFPGLNTDIEDVEAFHAMLVAGLSPIKEVPASRWDADVYYDAERSKADKIINRKGGFLNNPQLFDADFFKISPAEAKQIDPQHRIFLEVAIRALNHANITMSSLKGSNTGVYCGISTHDYSQLNIKDQIQFNEYTQIGAASSAATGRLSHFLDLHGPSMVIDTACSSSLSALCVAANALRSQQCSMAIVGGVHLNLTPEHFIGLTKANMLSASGQCSSFDQKADGFVRSEGCAVLIVKRLEDALQAKDTIHAVIKSIVMNNNGDGMSLVAPSEQAQIAMHQAALEQAQLQASDIDYIETHGTGTVSGDSIEFNAIQQLHRGQHANSPLLIGALKSSLGHTISASGLASLMKVIGALQHEIIPPNLHYTAPNKAITPDAIPAILPVKPTPFNKQKNKTRYAQISNFGFSGTNVSTVVEEAPAREYIDTKSAPLLCFTLSAKSDYSLRQMIAAYMHYLETTADHLADICHTLLHCRDHYKFRCALVVQDKKQLILKLKTAEYSIQKVRVKQEQSQAQDAQQIYQDFLSGIQFQSDGLVFNKVALPLYPFHKKPYWHEPRISNQSPINNEPIAIIGMSCRFPKAAQVDEFLSLLNKGESGMQDIPPERWDNSLYYDSNPETLGKLYIKQLGLLDHIKAFDADFFNISPREAKFMAPQLRIVMETSYHALEHSNLSLQDLKGSKTGVFMGVSHNEYPRLLDNQGLTLEDLNIYNATGNALNALAGRVAYTFDFNGPIQVVDTACSSSMTAIHNACLSLQAGDCDLALAGGVNIILTPNGNITLSKAKMLSPASLCKTFSEDADGYARSEGCGIIVLKRLSSAIKDKDNVLAVIKGSAINSDGKSDSFTVPNSIAQEQVILSALTRAQLAPKDIDYIEAHGTGTPLADPIEANTVSRIFGSSHSPQKPLYISSVKTNIGHCESASGVASVIKTVLSLQTHTLFKHLNFKKLNPNIELINTVIPLNTMKWEKDQGLRNAGVSSFGFSGANAHLVLQESPLAMKQPRQLPPSSLLVLSAKSKASLQRLLESYRHYLSHTEHELVDICYTAAVCRAHYAYRVAILADNAKQASAAISNHQYHIHHIKKEPAIPTSSNSLENLQSEYLDGQFIDWPAFYASLNTPVHKVILPLYAFDREEHWFEHKQRLTDTHTPKDWSYQLSWQSQPLDKKSSKDHAQDWLLIESPHLASHFMELGLNIVLETQTIALNQIKGIIFAPDLSTPEPIAAPQQPIKKLLALIKTLVDQHIQIPLIVITNQAIAEQAAQPINLKLSPLIGFCKTLALELPQFQTVLIDVEQSDPHLVAQQVLAEIHYNHNSHYEHQVAYRNGDRLVPRLKPIALPARKPTLNGSGRYLITGGCGGLGMVTAQALLSAGARELVLISRQVATPAIQDTLKTIQAAYPGRSIRALSLDITDKQQLRLLLSELNSDGLLKGIVHAAGQAIKASIIDHQEHHVDQVFAAKVTGAWYLHELSQDFALDFFIVYSSIASVFGSIKESVYSAANSYLDALITARHQLGLVGTSVQWGPWGEAGMSVKRSRDPLLKQALISNQQGHAWIKELLTSDSSHRTIIAPAYLNFMLDFVTQPMPAFYQRLAADLQTQPQATHDEITKSSQPTPWLQLYHAKPKDQRLSACEELICSICKDILELPPSAELEQDEGFFEIGFDSLMMTELASALKKVLEPSVSVLATIGFNYPSINKLSQHIQSAIEAQLKQQPNVNRTSNRSENDIAIIGMSCSLPNAPDLIHFQQLLEQGLSGIKDIPIERWDNSKYYDPDKEAPRKSYVNKMGLIDKVKAFDAHFFGISPREAKLMDPQQRLFLQCSYKALEHANYAPNSLSGSLTGVFAGVGPNEYYATLEKSGFSNEELSGFSITGNVLNLIPGRVAYAFDFKGPSISIDTSCSSSLVAIHYACNSLKNGEADLALAGGVNILLMPESNITLCKAKALSPEGLCKTFDAQADGYARGEGCGVVVLKRLGDALRDKDNILAVIKGSAVNNDGKTSGLTVPNGLSQEAVMKKALSQTDLVNTDISYLEAHGTGTPLGDPIEAHSIESVYGAQRQEDNPLYLGTVKTNIGHLEAASGAAALIKTIISLQNNTIYKHLNFTSLNPKIQLSNTKIALDNTPWNTLSRPKCAGINAFGFSGTNAHILVQEYPRQTSPRISSASQPSVLLLSAKSKTALQNLQHSYQEYLEHTDNLWEDICFTAATCRNHYSYRLALYAEDSHQASLALKEGHFALSYEPEHALEIPDQQSLQILTNQYLQGLTVDWASYYQNSGQDLIKVTLPHYVFDQTEFWTDKKSEPSAQPISYTHCLDHLYGIEWHKEKDVQSQATSLPEFWVISNDTLKTPKLFGNLNYKQVHDSKLLESIENKHLIYLYEQQHFLDLVLFCQTMFKSPPKSFTLVTENAHAIVENDPVNPYHTMAYAFWKSFRNEIQLPAHFSIDLQANSTLFTALNYLFDSGRTEDQLALRDSMYVPRLKKQQIRFNSEPKAMQFSSDATYLIVGGTGGLAKPLIEYLIGRGAKHLIITSRSVCPVDMQNLIEIQKQQHIDVRHLVVDASNYTQMEQLFQSIAQGVHPLKGVFHLAGVIQDGLIINLKQDDFQKVNHAKMESALILHQLTQNMALEQFVLFSSTASLLGAKGQSNYVAANGFLDGLAWHRKQQGLPATVINWGPFADLGMTKNLTQSLSQYGFIPLNTDSMDILDVILKNNITQIAPCSIQWDTYFKHSPEPIELSELRTITPLVQQYFLQALQLSTEDQRISLLSQALIEITAQVLRIDDMEQIKAQDDLLSLGLDSLMSIEIRNRIHDKLSCPDFSLSIEYFINNPSIDKIARKIASELPFHLHDGLAKQQPLESREKEIALCDFQYLFWAINHIKQSYNTAMQIRLQGALNMEMLEHAFEFVVHHNDVFWMSFNQQTPTQQLIRQGQFRLSYDDLSLDYDAEYLNHLFYQNMMRIIPLTERPLIRVFVYKINSQLYELHLIFPHIIVDDSSCEIVFNQFKHNYELLYQGKKPLPSPEKENFLSYVKNNNLHYQKNLQQKMDFWQAYNQDCTPLYLGYDNHIEDAAAYQSQHLYHYPIPAQSMKEFIDWHQAQNINISSGLIAACQLAFTQIRQQTKIPVILIHTGREGSSFKSVVGLFSEYKRINLTSNVHQSFTKHAQAVEEQLLLTAPYQKCSYFIKNAGLHQSGFSLSLYLAHKWHQWFKTKAFQESKLAPSVIDHYLEYLSRIKTLKLSTTVKHKLNRLFNWKLPLQKPDGLKVLINITSSMFTKQAPDTQFANLEYSYPSYFGGLDRPIGNQTLWLYFSRNAQGEYILSINGPLTTECKNQIAHNVKQIITNLNESCSPY